MKMFVGLTDYDWYCKLKTAHFDEVNFWRPGSVAFRALEPNELFLFKLKKPYNAIVGGGFFAKYSRLPIQMAWDIFEKKNGTDTYVEFAARLQRYRDKNKIDLAYPDVGCIILTQPFFFEPSDWIDQPSDWPVSAVVGKMMDAETGQGKRIYEEIQQRLAIGLTNPFDLIGETRARYQQSLVNIRLGQGAFRVLVTDTYSRRCAISGERTLPVLEAAHIKPYVQEGPHLIQNGVLLRSDIHKLFDDGYMTIDTDYRVEVSRRLYEDFGNGKIYYQYHGRELSIMPHRNEDFPDRAFLSWHNENVYLG